MLRHGTETGNPRTESNRKKQSSEQKSSNKLGKGSINQNLSKPLKPWQNPKELKRGNIIVLGKCGRLPCWGIGE